MAQEESSKGMNKECPMCGAVMIDTSTPSEFILKCSKCGCSTTGKWRY